MDEAEPDVLAFMTFLKDHSTKIHSSNPLEHVNKEIKRRTNGSVAKSGWLVTCLRDLERGVEA